MSQAGASGARGREAVAIVTATLQHYADRGVFRDFRAERAPRGRVRYTFSWLTRVPMSVVLDPSRGVLSFQRVFQGIEPRSPITAALKALVHGRSDRRLPSHKRLDSRRARVVCVRRQGALNLTFTVRGRHHEYTVRHALNLINDLFVLLRQTYPDYLIENFGVSAE